MNKKALLLGLLLVFACQVIVPAACFAFETRRVVLVGPVDTAKYQSRSVNAIITDSWKRVFRYPFYEIVVEIPDPKAPVDQAMLEKIADEHDADIVVVTEIVRLYDFTYTRYGRGFLDDDTWQEIQLLLTAKTYARKGGLHHAASARRWQVETLSVDSGAEPLVADAMEEILAKLPYKRVPQDS